jgi:excisionase family DNA binding protein
MSNTPRMQSIRQLVADFRRVDSQTGINEHFIRGLIAKNSIPFVRAGKKYLVNVEALELYLGGNGSGSLNTSGTKDNLDKGGYA